MINLRGIKLNGSKLGLTVYLPIELPLEARTMIEKTVKDRMAALKVHRGGCLYDTELETR